MKCKVLNAIHRGREGGRYEAGAEIDLDEGSYERLHRDGHVVSLEEFKAIAEGERLIEEAKAKAQAMRDELHASASKRANELRKGAKPAA